MSQHGKRNYRPRQNNNQIEKELQQEQQKNEKTINDVPAVENEIEIEKQPEEIVVVPEVIKEERIKITTPPQIVKSKPEQTKDEWLEEVIKQEPTIVKEPKKEIQKEKRQRNTTKKFKKEKQVVEENKVVKQEKAHYVFGRDSETGKTSRINNYVPEEKPMNINNTKNEVLNQIIIANERDIAKMEIEIEINEKLRDKELDITKIEVLDRKITNMRDTLEELNKRKQVLNELLKEYNK